MIFHIALAGEWQTALRNGVYSPLSLDHEGFIHCSARDQVIATANLFYRGRTDLMLLAIDEGRLVATLRYESPAAAGDARATQRFPHIYGPLNLDAVISTEPLRPGPGGNFDPPPSLRDDR